LATLLLLEGKRLPSLPVRLMSVLSCFCIECAATILPLLACTPLFTLCSIPRCPVAVLLSISPGRADKACSRGPGWGSWGVSRGAMGPSALRTDLSAASHKCLNLLWNLQKQLPHAGCWGQSRFTCSEKNGLITCTVACMLV
jgi:hypothetical protein